MKSFAAVLLAVLALTQCSRVHTSEEPESVSTLIPLKGTWKLLTGTLIQDGDTVVTDYTKGVSMIKIINDSHFAFLNHDLYQGSDSLAVFTAGGGSYTLAGDLYTEHLEYCNAREWEDHNFSFKVTIRNDTLIQSGIEELESAGINRMNIEKYVRIK